MNAGVDSVALDAPARALAARRVAVAFARGLLVIGLLKTIGWLAPPTIFAPAFQTGLAAVIGCGLLFSLMGHRGGGAYIAGANALLVAGALSILSAVASLTPYAKLGPPVHMSPAYERVFSLFMARYGDPPWLAARCLAALMGLVIGVELCRTARLLRSVPRPRRGLLSEPAGRYQTWFVDISAGVMRYARKDWGTTAALFVAAIVLLWSQTSAVGVSTTQHDRMLDAVADCVGAVDVPLCEASAARTAVVGVPLGLFTSVVFFPFLGSLLQQWAQHRAARSVSKRLTDQEDPRAPLLFLRGFSNDQVSLARDRFSLLGYAVSPSRTTLPLDSLLVHEFMHLGPPRALGRPGERFPPFGAIRVYPRTEDWEGEMQALARRARAIVLVFDGAPTPGVVKELEFLASEPALLNKTVLVADPRLWLAQGDSRQKRHASNAEALGQTRQAWSEIAQRMRFDVPRVDAPILSLVPSPNGAPLVTTVWRVDRSSMLLALRAGFAAIPE